MVFSCLLTRSLLVDISAGGILAKEGRRDAPAGIYLVAKLAAERFLLGVRKLVAGQMFIPFEDL